MMPTNNIQIVLKVDDKFSAALYGILWDIYRYQGAVYGDTEDGFNQWRDELTNG